MRKHLSERALHLCMALGLILAGSTGCSDNEEIPEPQPLPVEFKLKAKPYSYLHGDEQSVNYTVENGLKNATIKVTADKEWILDPQAADGKITFTVELSSEEQTREATVTPCTKRRNRPDRKVVQGSSGGLRRSLQVSVDAVTPVSATISLTVSDPSSPTSYSIRRKPLGKLTRRVIGNSWNITKPWRPPSADLPRSAATGAKGRQFQRRKITGLLPARKPSC